MKTIKIRKISYKQAKKEVVNFFVNSLSRGVKKTDVSEVAVTLKIPGEQAERILLDFINNGAVKKI